MFSFEMLLDQMEQSSPLMDSGEETKAMQLIRAGLNLRNDTFWDDFIQMCSNTEGMADLLGVQREAISGLPAKIKELVEKVDGKDDQGQEVKEKDEILPTGSTGAVTTDNMDQFGRTR